MEELAEVLRQERHQLEVLLYRLTTTRGLLREDRVRFLGWAAEEVQRARRHAREGDLLRAAHVQLLDVRGEGGQPPTLRQLAASAGDPWAGILRDHHDAMAELVAQIEVVAHDAAELARRGIRRLAEEQGSVGSTTAAARNAPPRTRPTSPVEPRPAAPKAPLSTWRATPFSEDLLPDDDDLSLLTKESAYQAALTASGRLQIPSLIAFIR